MKRIKFVWDENDQVQAVEDPNGPWRLYELPGGGTVLGAPAPGGNVTIGIDPERKDGQPCTNPYCRFHIRTACETCGRVNMRTKK